MKLTEIYLRAKLLEGTVASSWISHKDYWYDHNAEDKNIEVYPDPPYRRLLSTTPDGPGVIEVEWEYPQIPEAFWSSDPPFAFSEDRVSVYGAWVQDCGHAEDAYTEIHPPVLMATHKPRPIMIDPTFKFKLDGENQPVLSRDVADTSLENTATQQSVAPTQPGSSSNNGTAVASPTSSRVGDETVYNPSFSVGTNVYVPGIVTDIWVNRNGGEATEDFNPNPINRVFDFNIYLPPSPQSLYKKNNVQNAPEVPLYCKIISSDGTERSCFDLSSESSLTVTKQPGDGVPYLKASLDLRSYAGDTFSSRIVSGWVYPSPDNWSLSSWRLKIDNVRIIDDSDINCGNFRVWLNTPSVDKEWVKILDSSREYCDDDIVSPDPGSSWETGPAGSNAFLGTDILSDSQGYRFAWIAARGFEEDLTFDDNSGTVSESVYLSQGTSAVDGTAESKCVSGDSCGKYSIGYSFTPLGSVTPSLSPSALEIYEKFQALGSQVQQLQVNTSLQMEKIYRDDESIYANHEPDFKKLTFTKEFLNGKMTLDPAKTEKRLAEIKEIIVNRSANFDINEKIAGLEELKRQIPSDLWNKNFKAEHSDVMAENMVSLWNRYFGEIWASQVNRKSIND